MKKKMNTCESTDKNDNNKRKLGRRKEGRSQRTWSLPRDKHGKNKKNWKGGVHLVAQCRSGGATPALPLPEILPTSLLPPLLLFHWILERKCWQSPPSPLLNLCLPHFLSFFPHSLSVLPTTTFFYFSCFLHFSPCSPLSPLSCLTLLNQQHVGLMETRPCPILLWPTGFSLVHIISFILFSFSMKNFAMFLLFTGWVEMHRIPQHFLVPLIRSP